MAVLTARKREIVQSVIEAAPDSAIRSLELALASDGAGDGLMSGVRALVEHEAGDRYLRNIVFEPIVPLCAVREPDALTFPSHVLGRLWRGLRAIEPDMVKSAIARANWNREEGPPPIFDELCARAAVALRERHEAFSAIAPDDADGLADCLDLAPLVRGVSEKVEAWTNNMTGERAAAARLAYRDACAISDDSGPRFFEMLAAQLERPWLILRVISAVMDRPGERYLASSELSRFGDRVVGTIEALVEQVRRFDPVGGEDGQGEASGLAAGRSVDAAIAGIVEFEEAVTLAKEGPWGRAVANHKQTLAKLVEARLAGLDKLVGQALPLDKPRFGGAKARGTPSLDHDPDPATAARAAGGLTFADAVRSASVHGGFGAARAKALEKVNERLDHYTDDLLAHLRDPEAEHTDRARALLEAAARLVALSQDDKAAQILRRRIAAAA